MARQQRAMVWALLAALAAPPAGALDLPWAGGGVRLGVTSLKEARFQTTVPQQFDFSCGSAAVATLLSHHYGVPVTEQAVFEQMVAHGDVERIRREGFSLLDMRTYLVSRGFEADGFEAPLDQLARSALPAVVLIAERGYHHFVVLKGLRDGRVLLGDPATGTRAMAREDFERVWVDRVLFVIHSHQDVARFNQEADWSRAPAPPWASARQLEGGRSLLPGKFGPGDF